MNTKWEVDVLVEPDGRDNKIRPRRLAAGPGSYKDRIIAVTGEEAAKNFFDLISNERGGWYSGPPRKIKVIPINPPKEEIYEYVPPQTKGTVRRVDS